MHERPRGDTRSSPSRLLTRAAAGFLVTAVELSNCATRSLDNPTALEDELRSRDVHELVVAGMMSSMCVDATVRAAADLGFAPTVVHDACAAPDLTFGGETIPGRTVHAAFMAALGGGYASLIAAADFA